MTSQKKLSPTTLMENVKASMRSPQFLATWCAPLGTFLATLLLYGYGFNDVPVLACIVTAVTILAACVMIRIAMVLEGRGRKSRLPLKSMGLGMLPAAVIGTVLGLYIFDEIEAYRIFYANARQYTDVSAGDSALGVADAGTITFLSGAKVLTEQSYGFLMENGEVYCVAPIQMAPITTRDEDGVERAIEFQQGDWTSFWAAGVNCCTGEGEFWCDDAGEGTSSAAVIFDNRGYFSRSQTKYFEKAKNAAQAKHDLLTRFIQRPGMDEKAEDVMYVRWLRADKLTALGSRYRKQAAGYTVLFVIIFGTALAALAKVLII